MISKEIHQSGAYINLPPVTKILYDDLVLYADDDGFCTDVTLINLMDKATDENYKQLEDNNLVIKLDGAYLIVDWLNTEQLTHYKRTSLLNLSAQVFIRTDFRYTTDQNDKSIALSLDDWVERANRSRKINLKALQHQRLQQSVNKMDTSGKHNVNKKNTKCSPSIDKNSIDKSRLGQSREDQNNQDQKNLNKCVYNATSSSNGGMGEDTSYTRTENRQSSVHSSNQSTNPKMLIEYINQMMATSIPLNDKRLNRLFSDLLNQYKAKSVQLGLANLLTEIQDLKGSTSNDYIKRMVVDHLLENIKTVTTGKDGENNGHR